MRNTLLIHQFDVNCDDAPLKYIPEIKSGVLVNIVD
jgi:hypothetical protein